MPSSISRARLGRYRKSQHRAHAGKIWPRRRCDQVLRRRAPYRSEFNVCAEAARRSLSSDWQTGTGEAAKNALAGIPTTVAAVGTIGRLNCLRKVNNDDVANNDAVARRSRSNGPPVPEELADLGVGEGFLCELALKHVAMLAEPTTTAVAERLHLPRSLTEEILQKLYREKLIEVRLQTAVGSTRYAMLDHGWDRLLRLLAVCGYSGAAPVSLNDYAHMMRLQSIPSHPASMDTVRQAFHDLILPESLLQTLGCVINSRRSLFLRVTRHRKNRSRRTHQRCVAWCDLDSVCGGDRRANHSRVRFALSSHRARRKLRRLNMTGVGC